MSFGLENSRSCTTYGSQARAESVFGTVAALTARLNRMQRSSWSMKLGRIFITVLVAALLRVSKKQK